MTTIVSVSLDANSPCPIKWQPNGEDTYYIVLPGETVDATHNITNAGTIWHVAHDPDGDDAVWTFIKQLPAAADHCSGSSNSMGNPKYTGSVDWDYCDNGEPNTVAITILTAPDLPTYAPWALLHLVTRPEGAYAIVGAQEMGGVTDQIWQQFFTAGTYTEKVEVKLTHEHFKDKLFHKTLRPGLSEYALYRLSPADKIKGKTKKSSASKSVAFTFSVLKRADKSAVLKAGTELKLLNQFNGQIKTLTTNALGVAAITILYDDDFFASGRQKLVCIMKDTADRIRTFKTITVSKVASDSVDADEDWHEEGDDITAADSRRAIDDAYSRI